MENTSYNEIDQPDKNQKLDIPDSNSLNAYRDIVENSLDAILLTAPDGHVRYANQAACGIFQMTAQEIIDGGRESLVDINDPRLSQAIEARSKTGLFNGELNLKKKDGTIFPGQVSSSIFLDSQGQQLTSIIIRDVSAQKQIENRLTASELWMRCIFNSLEEGVFVVSTDRILMNINNAAERIFGYSKEELVGKSTEILHVDPQHYVNFGKRISDAFNNGKIANFEFGLKRKNGEIFPSEHTVSLLRNDSGKEIGIVSVVRDISKQKQKEQERETLVSNLQNALSTIKTLSGLLPICSICKNIRNDKGYWDTLENYIEKRSDVQFSHSLCPDCLEKQYPDHVDDDFDD